MTEGNDVDLGAIYRLLQIVAMDVREMRHDPAGLGREMADKSDITPLKAEIVLLRADIADLRKTVTQFPR